MDALGLAGGASWPHDTWAADSESPPGQGTCENERDSCTHDEIGGRKRKGKRILLLSK